MEIIGAGRHGQDPARLRMVAVTKTHPIEVVRAGAPFVMVSVHGIDADAVPPHDASVRASKGNR
jgi:hypothetical protein